MSKRLVTALSAAAVLATLTAMPASSASLSVTSSEYGAKQLRKVLKPHFWRIPITTAIRAAAGDPNMAVFDRRSGDQFTCSFITYRGKRAMACD